MVVKKDALLSRANIKINKLDKDKRSTLSIYMVVKLYFYLQKIMRQRKLNKKVNSNLEKRIRLKTKTNLAHVAIRVNVLVSLKN